MLVFTHTLHSVSVCMLSLKIEAVAGVYTGNKNKEHGVFLLIKNSFNDNDG